MFLPTPPKLQQLKRPTVLNVSRIEMETATPLPPGMNFIWISLRDPDEKPVDNPAIDAPRLDVVMHDITEKEADDEVPPSATVADEIVRFLDTHRDCHVIVNCYAGVARSGAVAEYCHEQLGLDWLASLRKWARPNPLLRTLLVEANERLRLEKRQARQNKAYGIHQKCTANKPGGR